jgi:hypothetical protein
MSGLRSWIAIYISTTAISILPWMAIRLRLLCIAPRSVRGITLRALFCEYWNAVANNMSEWQR